MTEREQIERAIAALDAQRAALDEVVVDTMIATAREKLHSLDKAQATPQRKQVTVLFADVSGFMALAERMDAEEVSETLNALWARLDGVITACGGMVDKHLGDGVMAIFGAPIAHEDDPEQAIRAALAMQREISDVGLQIVDWGGQSTIAMRIGINTGPVLLGQVGTTGEYTAVGETVNLASRLEQAAPEGGILISHDTYRHVRGLFDVQALAPLRIRGKTEPIRVYVVRRVKPRAFRLPTRGVEGVETRMIGRDAELERLQKILYTVTEERKARLVTVVGDAGIGKSRLLCEFEKWVEMLPDNVIYLKGRASQRTSNLPYSLILDLFAFRFGIRSSAPPAVARENLEQGIVRLMCGDRPVVLLLEDLHWADDGSLDMIEHLARAHRRSPLLIVALTRPELFERRAAWGNGQAVHTRLELRSLSIQDSHHLVHEILRRVEHIPPDLSDLIVDQAEGNPFYIEELIRMLIEDGVIVQGGERWSVELGRLTGPRVPPTLTGVLQARLDALPPLERETLQRAAVVGRVFWDGAVERLNRDASTQAGETARALAALQSKGLILKRETSRFAGQQEFVFKHTMLHEVAYESVLKRQRRAYHAQVAAWLVAQSGERVAEQAGLIGRHYERAEKRAAAAEWVGRAGCQDQELSASEAVTEPFSSGEIRKRRPRWVRMPWRLASACASGP
jgi:class 3 adenylate cyclase